VNRTVPWCTSGWAQNGEMHVFVQIQMRCEFTRQNAVSPVSCVAVMRGAVMRAAWCCDTWFECVVL